MRPPRTKGWVIERDDRELYAGTADHKARYGQPAVFATEKEAQERAAGLREQEPGRRFHVRPSQVPG